MIIVIIICAIVSTVVFLTIKSKPLASRLIISASIFALLVIGVIVLVTIIGDKPLPGSKSTLEIEYQNRKTKSDTVRR
jgi:hypothetical protein